MAATLPPSSRLGELGERLGARGAVHDAVVEREGRAMIVMTASPAAGHEALTGAPPRRWPSPPG